MDMITSDTEPPSLRVRYAVQPWNRHLVGPIPIGARMTDKHIRSDGYEIEAVRVSFYRRGIMASIVRPMSSLRN